MTKSLVPNAIWVICWMYAVKKVIVYLYTWVDDTYQSTWVTKNFCDIVIKLSICVIYLGVEIDKNFLLTE